MDGYVCWNWYVYGVARNRQIIRRQQGLVVSKVVFPWYDEEPYGRWELLVIERHATA